MFYVYLLRDSRGKFYVGATNDLRRRVVEHVQGEVYTTARMASPRLTYYEAYLTKSAASLRERKLKQFGSAFHGLLKRLGYRSAVTP